MFQPRATRHRVMDGGMTFVPPITRANVTQGRDVGLLDTRSACHAFDKRCRSTGYWWWRRNLPHSGVVVVAWRTEHPRDVADPVIVPGTSPPSLHERKY